MEGDQSESVGYDRIWDDLEQVRKTWIRSDIELLLSDDDPPIGKTREAIVLLCDVAQVLANDVRWLLERHR